MNGMTHNLKPICPVNFFEVGGIKMLGMKNHFDISIEIRKVNIAGVTCIYNFNQVCPGQNAHITVTVQTQWAVGLKIIIFKGRFSMKCHTRSIFMDILDKVLLRWNGDSTKKTFDEIVIRQNCSPTKLFFNVMVIRWNRLRWNVVQPLFDVYTRSKHYLTHMLEASKYAWSNHYWMHTRSINVCTEQL